MSDEKGNTAVQSIQRAIAILRSFTEAEPELGITTLSKRLGLHKSTVFRLLATLEQEGLISQNPETEKYRLGVGLVSLAGVALGRLNVRGAAQPHMNALADLSQETVNLTILDGKECVNIERIASPKPIQYVGWIGRRTPPHATASGQVLLAALPPEQRDQILPASLTQYTPKTIAERPILETRLFHICQQGYAIVHEEFEAEFSAIAAPIFNHLGQTIASLSISGPTYRLGPGKIEALVESVTQSARRISADLGYHIR